MNDPRTTALDGMQRLHRRVRRRVLAQGAFSWSALAVPALTVSAWLAGGERLHGGFIAAGLSLSLLALLLLSAVHFLWRPWRRYATRRDLVRVAEARGAFENVLVAAEEAARIPARWSGDDPIVRELARRLDARAAAALATLTPAQVHPVGRTRARGLALGAGTVLAATLCLSLPDTMARGLALLVRPLGQAATREAGGLFAEPAPAWVAAGGAVTLAATDFAVAVDAARCEVRFGESGWTVIDARAEAAAAQTGVEAGLPVLRRRWTATLTDVREDFSWRYRRGGQVTTTGRVAVRQPPLLARLAARVEPPAYTGLPAAGIERLPAVSEVPAGSRVTLSAQAGDPLAAAWLATSGDDSLAMAVDGNTAVISMTVTRDLAFTVGLRDRFGLGGADALQYRIVAMADQPPGVTLVRPQDDGQLPLDGKVTLLVEATDDFGLRRLDLLAGMGADLPPVAAGSGAPPAWAQVAIGPLPAGTWLVVQTDAGPLRVRARDAGGQSTALRAALALDLEAGDLDLVAGDVLDLVIEARDNRAPGEGNLTRSAVLRLALPSAADALAAQAESARQGREEMEEARRRGTELDADLERLARELLKNPIPDWTRQQEMEAAVQRQQALQDELARVAEELRRQIEELARGRLTSENQLERAEQMAELLTPPPNAALEDLLEKLTKGDSPVSPDEVTRAMEEVAHQQKDLARRLDAALALTRRMEEEQRLEGLTSLLEEMMRKQQELADQSRDLSGSPPPSPPESGTPPSEAGKGDQSPDAEELARRQEALARELEQLREQLEEALAQQGESPPSEGEEGESPSPQEQALREALAKLEKQQSSGGMDKASKMLQQMDPGQAAQMQQQALRDLGSLYSVLMASQQAMQSALKMEQVSSLRGLASDLLVLSSRQEELGERIPALLQDVRNVELTRQQHRLQKAAVGTRDRLAELMDEAPNRIIKILEKLDALIEEMGGGVRALDEGRAAAAREQAGRSLAETNRIVIGLLTEAQMAGGGGGGGGQQKSASEQLQDMARRQAELNGATEELRQMLADRGISQAARAQMQRLGQQQAELGRELGRVAELEKERPQAEGERILGDLQELGRQMERVGGDLDDGQVDHEVLQRQDRILGRLLDARNSVRERDYSSRRESRAAARTFTPQQGAPGGSDDDRAAAWRQRYQRLEDAPLEYRDLVRRYFAAIDSLQRGDQLGGTGREGALP